MELQIKISRINYGEVAVKALPLLRAKIRDDGSAVAKILLAITQLPPEMICGIFDAMPQEQKDEIVALLAAENKEKLLKLAMAVAEKNGIRITVEDVTVSKELQIGVFVRQIDYAGLVVRFLPLVKDKLKALEGSEMKILTKLADASSELACEFLKLIPREYQDKIAVFLLNQCREQILEMIVGTFQKNGIEIEIEDFVAEQ